MKAKAMKAVEHPRRGSGPERVGEENRERWADMIKIHSMHLGKFNNFSIDKNIKMRGEAGESD